jgi:multidrug efflux pump subunit AcrB
MSTHLCSMHPRYRPAGTTRAGSVVQHLLGGLLVLAVVATGVQHARLMTANPAAPAAPRLAATLIAPDAAVPALRDAAETIRERLLGVSGVGAVTLRGVLQQRLVVEYAPSSLARLGLTPADLAAALPTDPAQSASGHLALRPEATQQGPQPIANLGVHAGGRVFRLGDIAAVTRAKLEPPVSILTRNGHPAVEILVTPAQGASRAALDHALSRAMAAAAPSDAIEMTLPETQATARR